MSLRYQGVLVRRFARALFFALVACGTSFYLATFLGLMAEALRGSLNAGVTPGFSSALRHVLLPLSVAVGVLTFLLAWLRPEKRSRLKADSS